MKLFAVYLFVSGLLTTVNDIVRFIQVGGLEFGDVLPGLAPGITNDMLYLASFNALLKVVVVPALLWLIARPVAAYMVPPARTEQIPFTIDWSCALHAGLVLMGFSFLPAIFLDFIKLIRAFDSWELVRLLVKLGFASFLILGAPMLTRILKPTKT